jgi:hypothetical protein
VKLWTTVVSVPRDARHLTAARHPEVLQRAGNGEEFTIFDFASDGD